MNKLVDSYKHRGMRKSLVRIIKEKGIKDQRVLDAIGTVPRHFFFDEIFVEHAYQDKAFPIAAGQTISQPYTVAFQTEKLEIKPGAKILEIGTGSGYQASILAECGADVYTIEYVEELSISAKKMLNFMGYEFQFFVGDGSKGLKKFAPYDGIIVTAGAPTVPEELIQQLKVGGRLIIPVGDRKTQKMIRIVRESEANILKEEYNNFSFVPLKGDSGWGR